jgi:hypothetical protein
MITEQENYSDIDAIVSKNPELQKTLEGPIKWVGEEGFDECVVHLSKKKGITNAKKLCGYLKGKAREKGVLKKEHMGKVERKAKNRKFTKSELIDFLKSNLNYAQTMAEGLAELIFKKCSDGKIISKVKKVKKNK